MTEDGRDEVDEVLVTEGVTLGLEEKSSLSDPVLETDENGCCLQNKMYRVHNNKLLKLGQNYNPFLCVQCQVLRLYGEQKGS